MSQKIRQALFYKKVIKKDIKLSTFVTQYIAFVTVLLTLTYRNLSQKIRQALFYKKVIKKDIKLST
ncbi:hypothetical protein, partial [Staphylococcus aureus]|uniref:hypothetical protein n=1 Tax=Staphylococcus aureus TaxID=1280 RepID=UPI001C832430